MYITQTQEFFSIITAVIAFTDSWLCTDPTHKIDKFTFFGYTGPTHLMLWRTLFHRHSFNIQVNDNNNNNNDNNNAIIVYLANTLC